MSTSKQNEYGSEQNNNKVLERLKMVNKMAMKEKILGIEVTAEQLAAMAPAEQMNAQENAFNAWLNEKIENLQLVGSEKQVNWAKSIVRSWLFNAYHFCDLTIFASVVKNILALTEASTIIEQRNASANSFKNAEFEKVMLEYDDDSLFKKMVEYSIAWLNA